MKEKGTKKERSDKKDQIRERRCNSDATESVEGSSVLSPIGLPTSEPRNLGRYVPT
jgi:hypothetical protein